MADIAGTGPDPAGFDRAALEAHLLDLGRSLDLPPAPDLRSAVLARLDAPAGRARFGNRRAIRFAVAAIAALILLTAVTPAGQAAVARVVQAFGVVLHLGAPQAPSRPEQLPGEQIAPLESARRQVAFPVVVPTVLGRPDEVIVSDGGRVLSLVYRAGPGRPTPGPGGISARLDEFDGALDMAFVKELSAGAQWLTLPNGDSAVWIDSPHAVTYLDRSGTARTESSHLSGHTLIWTVGGAVSLRLEGDFTREAALAVAAATS